MWKTSPPWSRAGACAGRTERGRSFRLQVRAKILPKFHYEPAGKGVSGRGSESPRIGEEAGDPKRAHSMWITSAPNCGWTSSGSARREIFREFATLAQRKFMVSDVGEFACSMKGERATDAPEFMRNGYRPAAGNVPPRGVNFRYACPAHAGDNHRLRACIRRADAPPVGVVEFVDLGLHDLTRD